MCAPLQGDSGPFVPLMGQEGTSLLLCAEPWGGPLCWHQGFLLLAGAGALCGAGPGAHQLFLGYR